MKDELVLVRLYSPSDHDFTFMRDDGTIYVDKVRKGRDMETYTPEYQLELPI